MKKKNVSKEEVKTAYGFEFNYDKNIYEIIILRYQGDNIFDTQKEKLGYSMATALMGGKKFLVNIIHSLRKDIRKKANKVD